MARLGPERRLYLRIPLNSVSGTMKVTSVGGRAITTDPRPCTILNASGGGLWIRCEDDLQIRRTVVAVFAFTLEGQQYEFTGRLVRKLDDLRVFEYGILFIDVNEQQRKSLVTALGSLRVPAMAKP